MNKRSSDGVIRIRYWDFTVPDDVHVVGYGGNTEHLMTDAELDRAREAVEDFKAKYWADDAEYSHREMREADPEMNAMCGHRFNARNQPRMKRLSDYIELWIQGRLQQDVWHPSSETWPRGQQRWYIRGGYEPTSHILSNCCGNCIRSYRAKYGEGDGNDSWATDPDDPTETILKIEVDA